MSVTHLWSMLGAGQEQPQFTNYGALGHAPPPPPNNYGYFPQGYYYNPPPQQQQSQAGYSPPQPTPTPGYYSPQPTPTPGYYSPQPTPTPGCYPPQPSQAKHRRGNGKHGNQGQQNIHHISNQTGSSTGSGNGSLKIGNFGRQPDDEE